MDKSLVDVVFEVLVYGTVLIPWKVRLQAVQHDEFPVGDARKLLDGVGLRGTVQREVRGDDIVVEMVQVVV